MSGSDPPGIVVGTRAHLDALADVLARAFDDDPPTRWMVRRRSEPARRAATRRFFRSGLRHMGLPVDGVRATDGLEAAMIFAPPGQWSLGLGRTLRLLPDWIAAVGLARLVPSIAAGQAIERLHPEAPHYYVFTIGVRPEAQGRGLGTALLRHVLARADAEGIGTWLEATTLASARLYARQGFVERRTYDFPEGGPRIYGMWRPPAARPDAPA